MRARSRSGRIAVRSGNQEDRAPATESGVRRGRPAFGGKGQDRARETGRSVELVADHAHQDARARREGRRRSRVRRGQPGRTDWTVAGRQGRPGRVNLDATRSLVQSVPARLCQAYRGGRLLDGRVEGVVAAQSDHDDLLRLPGPRPRFPFAAMRSSVSPARLAGNPAKAPGRDRSAPRCRFSRGAQAVDLPGLETTIESGLLCGRPAFGGKGQDRERETGRSVQLVPGRAHQDARARRERHWRSRSPRVRTGGKGWTVLERQRRPGGASPDAIPALPSSCEEMRGRPRWRRGPVPGEDVCCGNGQSLAFTQWQNVATTEPQHRRRDKNG